MFRGLANLHLDTAKTKLIDRLSLAIVVVGLLLFLGAAIGVGFPLDLTQNADLARLAAPYWYLWAVIFAGFGLRGFRKGIESSVYLWVFFAIVFVVMGVVQWVLGILGVHIETSAIPLVLLKPGIILLLFVEFVLASPISAIWELIISSSLSWSNSLPLWSPLVFILASFSGSLAGKVLLTRQQGLKVPVVRPQGPWESPEELVPPEQPSITPPTAAQPSEPSEPPKQPLMEHPTKPPVPKVAIIDASNITRRIGPPAPHWPLGRSREEGPLGIMRYLDLTMEEAKKRYEKVIVIADASLKHKIDDGPRFAKMLDEGAVIEAPARSEADHFILTEAERMNAAVIVGDERFEDREKKFPWIRELGRRIPVWLNLDGNGVTFYEEGEKKSSADRRTSSN